MDEDEVDEAPTRLARPGDTSWMKAHIGVVSTGHAETRDLHELYAMLEKSEGPAEKNSTTIAASIGAGPMSPAVVGVDEAVGVDDGDAGDGLVLDEDEGGGQVAAATEVAAAAAKEERRRRPDGG